MVVSVTPKISDRPPSVEQAHRAPSHQRKDHSDPGFAPCVRAFDLSVQPID
jgi:hypothetical protein